MADPLSFPIRDYAPIGPRADFAPAPTLAETEASFGEYFSAAAGNVIRDSPTSSLYRAAEFAIANSERTNDPFASEFGELGTGPETGRKRTVTAANATAMAKDAGVKVDFGDASYTPEAVDIMIDRAKRRRVRDSVIASYKPSLGTQLGVSVLTSLADPLNIGAAFIPFAGQTRYAALLAGASGFLSRTGVRAGIGAVEGFGGAALVEPLIVNAATQEGRDYSLADSLQNLMFGAAFGGGLHVAGGAIAEKVFKRTYSNAPVETPADIIDRLPPEMKEAGMRAAISDLVEGRPVQASEVIDAYARDNNGAIGRAINYAESLRRDGPPIDDTVERIAYWEKRLTGQTAEKTEDFRQFLKTIGGIRDTGNALRAELGDDIGNLPRGTIITEAGGKRTPRGIEAERVIAEAITQGFVADRAGFIDALRSGGKGILRKADQENAESRAGETEHTKRMLLEAGVNPNTRNALKARAIVGREQQIVASERARHAAAVQSLESRFDGDEAAPKTEPLPEPGSTPLDELETRLPTAKVSEPAGKVTEADTLTAETQRRLDEISKWLPPEQIAEVRAAIEKSNTDLDQMNRVLESATVCVMGI